MALFTDGPAVSITDLTDEDSGLLTTAQVVGINVTTKLRLAMAELRSDLEAWLLRSGSATQTAPAGIGQVVATAELARWEKMQALAMVYRDAYFSELTDRYQGKWDEYTKLTRYARDQFATAGIGLVNDPVPVADLPVLGTETVTSAQAGGMFYAAVAWVNAEGQEGAASASSSIVVPAGSVMTAMAENAPLNAVGFNIYVGTVPAMMTLQTAAPLPVGTAFTYIPGAFSSNQVAGTGQTPDYVKALPRTMLRG
jgi:hypothetical protein